ncbi:hypothetical protein CN553_32140, partial [Bacillus cereus]
VLATVLVLGWNVAGDLSHAAGNGLSQEKETPEWSEKKGYLKGDIITYKGIQYEAKFRSVGQKPDESLAWIPMNGGIPEWNKKKIYFKGDIITYKGIQYEALHYSVGKKPDEHRNWIPMNGDIPEWNEKKTYFKDMIVTYEGIQYEAKCRSIGGSTPDKKESWIPEENEIKPDGEGDFEMVNQPDGEDDFEMVNKPDESAK